MFVKYINRKIVMQSPLGLHLDLASEISKLSSAYEARVSLGKANHAADAHSIFALITLGVSPGDKLEISAVGRDAEKALEAICRLLDSYSAAGLHRDQPTRSCAA